MAQRFAEVRYCTQLHVLKEVSVAVHGACRGVTGAMTFIEGQAGAVLVDCGLPQGAEAEQWQLEPGRPFKLLGKHLLVRATIETLSGLSAHADRRELLNWARCLPPTKVLALFHGEPQAQRALATALALSE
jgi:predicted metal-dependent RNase